MAYNDLRQQVLNAAREIFDSNLVTGTWGNVSMRAPGEQRLIITPSGMNYAVMEDEDLVVLDFDMKVVEGQYKPSVESPLHTKIYRKRPEINAIVHVHAPFASAFAVARKSIPVILEETAQVVGHEIPVAAYAHCGTGQLADNTLKALGTDKKAVLLANHGLVALGDNIEEAMKVCYITERSAMIAIYAKILGPPHALTVNDVNFLHRSFKDYGQEKIVK